MTNYREEQDSIGTRQVPGDVYYGVQTLRASENFKITGTMVHPELIRAMAEVKIACAMANKDAGVLDSRIADSIIAAGREVVSGKLLDNFIVDSIQGGAGTSMNMNTNEVISNRAIELLGGAKGDYSIVHPNDHTNCGQSTNDVIPSAGRIATIRLLKGAISELELLYDDFLIKAEKYKNVIKMGRTEMQDAVPISFGQVFSAYASAIKRDIRRFNSAIDEMSCVNMGATAIGTTINAHPVYIEKVVPYLKKVTGLELLQAADLIDATQNLDSFVYVSGIIKSCAATLSKIANDIRLMSSGPRTGFGEITLAAMQNGSSIMPGKVNPVIPEAMTQISFAIIGNDTTVTLAAEAGHLELNAFEPIIFRCLFESLDILRNGVKMFADECIKTLTVNEERCRELVDNSIGIVTALCPHLGYKESARLAKLALYENRSIRDVVAAETRLTPEQINTILDPKDMIGNK